MEKLKFTKKKLKVISVFLCICLVMGLALNEVGLLQLALADDVASWDGNTNVAVNAAYKYNGGQATNATGKSAASPFQIKTGEDLIQFAVNVNGGAYDTGTWYFQLANNITLNNNEWVPIGTEDHPFKGVFNGNSKTIMNMKLTSDSNTKNRNIGFFGCTADSTISNLNIVDSNITQSDASAGTYVGGLIGAAYRSTVTGCTYSGSVTGFNFVGGLIGLCRGSSGTNAQIKNCSAQGGSVTANGQAAGGLIGDLNYGLVLNCYNKCGVTLQSSASGKLSAGGIAGSSERSEIVNCYNTGAVNSSSVAGGIANPVAGTVTSVINCYNVGSVSGNVSGSICGSSDANCIFDNCFYLNSGVPFIPDAASANSMTNIGSFTGSGAYAAIEKDPRSTSWSYVENETLANALANKADALATKYSGILEWAADESGVNNNYPIHTSVSGHIHDKAGGETIIQEANCTEAGIVRRKCSQCDKTWDERIEPTKHSYETNPNQAPVIITPSTCTGKGQAKKVCTNMDKRANPPKQCGAEMLPYDLDPLGHATKTVSHAATCLNDAYVETICLNGGCTDYPQYVTYAGTALGHDYVAVSSAATCIEPAKMEYTCTRCHYSYTLTGDTASGAAIGLIPALGHEWDSDENGKYVSSTCVELGGYVRTCKRCTYSYFVNQDGEELAPHQYKKTVHDPTCTEEGYDEYLCTVCNVATYKDNFQDKLPHIYTSSVIKPTCTTEGYTRHTCLNCNDVYDDEITKTIDHDDELDTENSLMPTCVDDGFWLYRCTSCNRERRVKIDNGGGHNMIYSEEDSVKQTCELGGYDLYKCAKCGETEKRNVTQQGFGHNWAVRTLEPTCEDFGRTERFCDQCGSASLIGDQVPPLGHNYEKEVTEATTKTRGFTTYTCDRCKDEYKSDFIAATPDGHYNVLTQVLTLTDVDDELMSWSLDAGETWNVEEVSCVAVTTDAIDLETGIWVKRLGSRPGVQFFSEDILICSDSAIQIIEVKKSEAPSGITGINPIVEDGTGKITGLSTLMEYRMESEEEWHDVLSDTMENLSPGIYYFRFKATENFLASEPMIIEIKYVEQTDPPINTNPPGVTNPPGFEPGDTTPPRGSEEPDPSQTLPPGVTQQPNQSANPQRTNEPDNPNNPGNQKPSSTEDANLNPPNNQNQGTNNGNTNNGGNNSTNNNGNVNGNNNGNNSGNANGNTNGAVKTEAPSGVIPNTVYYSSNGGAGTTSTRTASRVAAKTSDQTNIAIWAVLACLSCAGVAIVCKKKEE